MSERMTELWRRYEAAYEAFRLNVNHPDEWESNAQTFEALTAARQAILDEGLKEERARVDGLVEIARAVAAGDPRDRLSEVSVYDKDGNRDYLQPAAERALAAVRESQVSEGGV